MLNNSQYVVFKPLCSKDSEFLYQYYYGNTETLLNNKFINSQGIFY